MQKPKISSFTDLIVWQKGHTLVLLIYRVTAKFPKSERFCLVDQMRRCAVSITSNIAEGYSRKGIKEKIQFYYMSKGSVSELQNQLLIAKDLFYIDTGDYSKASELTVELSKMLSAIFKSFREKQSI